MPKNRSAIPDFTQPRQYGECPACSHVGMDCHCHRRPKKAASLFVTKQLAEVSARIAVAREAVARYGLDAASLGLPVDFLAHEVGSSNVGPSDRFVVSLVVGFGPTDEVRTPKQAVAAALGLITEDDGAPDTQWRCYDRRTNQMRIVQQREAADVAY